jgi:hypothetical protein
VRINFIIGFINLFQFPGFSQGEFNNWCFGIIPVPVSIPVRLSLYLAAAWPRPGQPYPSPTRWGTCFFIRMDKTCGTGTTSLMPVLATLNQVKMNTIEFSHFNSQTGQVTLSFKFNSYASGTDRAIARGLNEYNPNVSLYPSLRGNAFPVRRVKDN